MQTASDEGVYVSGNDVEFGNPGAVSLIIIIIIIIYKIYIAPFAVNSLIKHGIL